MNGYIGRRPSDPDVQAHQAAYQSNSHKYHDMNPAERIAMLKAQREQERLNAIALQERNVSRRILFAYLDYVCFSVV